jgi:hypothetical protein
VASKRVTALLRHAWHGLAHQTGRQRSQLSGEAWNSGTNLQVQVADRVGASGSRRLVFAERLRPLPPFQHDGEP